MQQSDSHKPSVSKLDLFLTFSRITLSSFGGALFWARLGIVERRRWLTEREFAEFLTMGQLLPGPNVLNLTVLVGYRFGGWAGAAVSVLGYLGWPFLVVIGMGMMYQQFGALPQVQLALGGMSKVAAVLLLATVIKLAMLLPGRLGAWQPANIIVAVVGNLDEVSAVRMISDRLGSPAPLKDRRMISGKEFIPRAASEELRRHAEQGYVCIGYTTCPIQSPDYPALRMASAVLGEGMSARLFTILRDQEGLAILGQAQRQVLVVRVQGHGEKTELHRLALIRQRPGRWPRSRCGRDTSCARWRPSER